MPSQIVPKTSLMVPGPGFRFSWSPVVLFSFLPLRYLYHVLTKNTTVTEQNRNLLVETIRSITEILIWGDQNDSSVFE